MYENHALSLRILLPGQVHIYPCDRPTSSAIEERLKSNETNNINLRISKVINRESKISNMKFLRILPAFTPPGAVGKKRNELTIIRLKRSCKIYSLSLNFFNFTTL